MKENIKLFCNIGGIGKIKDNAFFHERTSNSEEKHFIKIEEKSEENEDEQ